MEFEPVESLLMELELVEIDLESKKA